MSRPRGGPPAARPPTAAVVAPSVTFSTQTVTSGPLPAPEILAAYGEVLPDLPERIIRLAETEAEHRRGLERHVVVSATRRATVGQVLGFLIGSGGLATAAYCAMLGHPATASIIATLDIVTLVSVFVIGSTRGRPAPAQPGEKQLDLPHVR